MNDYYKPNRWKSKVDALVRLATDSGATRAEADTARRKLEQILEFHPDAAQIREYESVKAMFTGAQFVEMKRAGVSTDGEWTGRTLAEAAALMVADYQERHRQALGLKLGVPE